MSATSSSDVSTGSTGSGRQQRLHGQDFESALFENRRGYQEWFGDDDRLGLDHVDDGGGVLAHTSRSVRGVG